MPTAYYKAFPLVVIDTAGGLHYAPSETINAYNVTQAASLGTLVSDADGVIASGSFTGVAVGDVVRFYHSTYPGEMRLTLRATADESYTDPESTATSLILENQMSTTTASPTVQIWLADTSQPDVKPIYLGNAKSGTTTLFPYQTSLAQSARVYAVSQDELGRVSTLDFAYADYEDFSISALGGGGALTIATKTANYTLTNSDDVILMDCTSGNLTVTLQAVATATQKPYYIKKIDSSGNSMTIDGNASETIDGATTKATSVQYTSYTIIPNNAGEWSIV